MRHVPGALPSMTIRALAVFAFLLLVKALSRLLFRHEIRWIGPVPRGQWARVRIGALLNHTSLFEPVFAGSCPNGFLWKLARDGAIPIADVTMKRPVAGLLFRCIAGQIITITRRRDASWEQVLSSIRQDSLVVLMPEGRMMRRGGLDKEGRPMTVRGGISDLIKATEAGLMLIGYSGGLHHVQAPGDRFPRLFRRIRINFECVDLAEYRAGLGVDPSSRGFKLAVSRDLERRRDVNCPATPETGKPVRVEDFEGDVERRAPVAGM